MDIPKLSPKETEILRLLIAQGEMYGLEMVHASPGLKRGTIYVTLGRMADKGYVESRQEKDPGSPGVPRRLFHATPYGRHLMRAWDTAAATIEIHRAAAEMAQAMELQG
jgi:DNA-binding PadR family transcriptional regulator